MAATVAAGFGSGGFSIREYVSRMRAVDVDKCWPFGAEDRKERPLPPIACRKFRWWADEVARLAEEEAAAVADAEVSSLGLEKLTIDEEKTVELELGAGGEGLVIEAAAASAWTDANARVLDGCLLEAPEEDERMRVREKKFKSRLRKKRSIVELFAVAPPVKSVKDDGDRDASSVTKTGKRKKKLKELMEMLRKNIKNSMNKRNQNKIIMAMTKTKKMKKKNKKKKKKKKKRKLEQEQEQQPESGILSLFSELEDGKKENIHKFKTPPQADSSQHYVNNKRSVNEVIDPVQKRKLPNMKNLLKKNRLKKNEASKLISDVQVEQPVLPIHGILKKKSRAVLFQKHSSVDKSKCVDLMEKKLNRHSDRHVRFSEKDEFLGHTKTCHSAVNLPQMNDLCEGHSDLIVGNPVEEPKKNRHSDRHVRFSEKDEFIEHTKTCHSAISLPEMNDLCEGFSDVIAAKSVEEQKRSRHSDRHVRFSEKDEIIGHTKTCHSSIHLPQMDDLCEGFSDVMAAKSVEEQPVEVEDYRPVRDEVQEVTECDKDVESFGRCSGGTYDAPCPLILARSRVSPEMGSISMDKYVDLNRPALHCESLQQFNSFSSNSSCNLSGSSTSFNSGLKEQVGGFPTEGSAPRTFITRRNLHEHFAYPITGSAAINSLANITRDSNSQHTSCYSLLNMDRNEKQLNSSLGARPSSSRCTLKNKKWQSLFPAVPFNSTPFSPLEKKKSLLCKRGHFGESSVSDPIYICSDKYSDDDYIGLPLNSQGELIKLQPSAKVGLNQVFKKQNTTVSSVGTFPIYNVSASKSIMDHPNMKDKVHMHTSSLKWFPELSYLNNNACSTPASSSSSFTALRGIGRTEVQFHDTVMGKQHSSLWLDPEHHLTNIPCCRQTAFDQHHGNAEKEKYKSVENSSCAFQPLVQPTLRLMGKNVMVGRRDGDFQGYEDGKVWADKEVIAEQQPPVTVLDNLAPRCVHQEWVHCPVAGVSDSINHSVETEMNPSSTSILHMTMVEPRSSGGFNNCQTQLMSFYGLPTINGKHGSELLSLAHMPLDKTSNFPGNSSENEFFRMSDQDTIQSSCSGNGCLHMMLNSMHSKHMLPYSKHDSGRCSHKSCFQCSQSVPSQLFNTAQTKETMFSHHPRVPDSFPSYHPCFISGANHLPLPSPYLSSMFSFSSSMPNISEHCLQNSTNSTSLAHQSLVAPNPGTQPLSITKTSLRNRMKGRCSAKPKSTSSLGHSQRTKKRPADKSNVSMESAKKLNYEIQDSNIVMQSKEHEQVPGYGGVLVGTNISRKATEKDGLGPASSNNAFKVDGAVRSGPIKLSAGAKHILRPCQNVDQDNSRPTHSTIPCTMVTDTGNAPDFHKKLAKIYRF